MAPLLGHHPVGASTGYMVGSRGNWPELVAEASKVSSFAVELTALGEDELPALLGFLAEDQPLPFRYVSVHGPSKGRRMPEAELVALLAELPAFVDAIVLHPDEIEVPARYQALGSRLLIENMDSRKVAGKNWSERNPFLNNCRRLASVSMWPTPGPSILRCRSVTNCLTVLRPVLNMSTSVRFRRI